MEVRAVGPCDRGGGKEVSGYDNACVAYVELERSAAPRGGLEFLLALFPLGKGADAEGDGTHELLLVSYGDGDV